MPPFTGNRTRYPKNSRHVGLTAGMSAHPTALELGAAWGLRQMDGVYDAFLAGFFAFSFDGMAIRTANPAGLRLSIAHQGKKHLRKAERLRRITFFLTDPWMAVLISNRRPPNPKSLNT